MIKCKQVYINGVSEHFRQYYNFMDFAILGLYLASYALRFATYYRVTEASFYFAIVKRQVYKPLRQRIASGSTLCQRQASTPTVQPL